jgi:diguanylate cyclase (GGDEF)-like protein/PAS domain S-box-containing protein
LFSDLIIRIHSVHATAPSGAAPTSAQETQPDRSSLEALAAWLDAPVCLIDADNRLAAATQRYAEFIGRDLAELPGLAFSGVVGDGNWAVLEPYIERARAGESLVITVKHARRGGQQGLSRIELKRFGHRCVIAALIGVEAALEPHPEQSADLIPLAMALLDREGRLTWTNPAFQQLLNLDPQNSGRDFPGSDESARKLAGLYAEALKGKSGSIEIPYRGNQAEPRWLRFDLIPDMSGSAHGIYIFAADVHDKRVAAIGVEHSEAHFRSFAENIPEAIAFLDRERRYRYANEAFLRLIGKSRDQVMGRSVEEVVGLDIAGQRKALFDRAMTGELITHQAYDLINGTRGWREIRYLPSRTAEGGIEGVYVVSRSIEDVKRAEDELRGQQTRINVLTDNLPAQISYMDAERRYRYCNQRFLIDNGLVEDEVIGHTAGEVFGEAVAVELEACIQRALKGEKVQYERRASLHASEVRWSRVSIVADLGEHGEFLGSYGIAYDITEARQAQERLREQQQWIESFIENFPQPLSYLSEEGRYRYANRAFADLIGKPASEIVGAEARTVFPLQVSEAMLDAFRLAGGGQRLRTEHAIDLPDGVHQWLAVDWLPDQDDGGKVRGVYTLTQDISEAKRAQLDYERSVQEMQRAMDSVALPISHVDAEERVRFVNHTSTMWYGRKASELIGLPLNGLMSQDDYRFAKPYIQAALAGQLVQYEREMRYHDGIRRWVLLRYVPTRDENGQITGFYTTATDIQARKKQELALQQANWLLTAHFENTPLASFTLDADQRVTRWSSQAEMLFGWPRDEVLEKPFWDLNLIAAEHAGDFFPRNESALGTEPNSRRHLVLARRQDGKQVACEWHIAALRDAGGRVSSILGLVQDVSQRVEAENRLIEIAQRDTLTKLLNRNALEPTLREFIERAKQDVSGVAVLFIDLDHFKNINDTLGHRVGDLMLVEIASTLRRCIRAEDEVARIGGDEFMVILGGHERPKAIAHETAQRIIHALRDPIRVENQRLSVAASIGVAVYPDHGRTPDALLRSADLAMYRAKENGKNRFEFFSASLAQRSERRAGIKTALRLALQRDALKLYYQPRVSVASGQMVGAEALLRWTDPRLGVVSPKEFISIAEESGLIHELGVYVFRKACMQIRQWQDAHAHYGTISVNFSAHQLLVATFIDEVDLVIEQTGCDPRCIEVEITETSMLFDLGITKNVISELKHRGMKIAIDDFGTGFSSLSHLQQLDIDTLKIDQTFIRDMLDDASDLAITRSVISLGRGLGLSVTAEGVENERQLAALKTAGCDHYQGFLYSPAVAVEDLEVLFATRTANAA